MISFNLVKSEMARTDGVKDYNTQEFKEPKLESEKKPKLESEPETLKEYPYLVTDGHLNNSYRKLFDKNLTEYHPNAGAWPSKMEQKNYLSLKLCVFANTFTRNKYQLFWTLFKQKIVSTSFSIEESTDLISDVYIWGGSYARFGNQNMHWLEDQQIWKLPHYDKCNPIFVLPYQRFKIETDGKYLQCHLGIILSNQLRNSYIRTAEKMASKQMFLPEVSMALVGTKMTD